jgi:ribonucleotide monophosphatase NagD (HAD superfamily)
MMPSLTRTIARRGCFLVQPAQGYLIDIDGTLQFNGDPLPGAIRFIRRLRERDIPFRLLTNTTSLTALEMAEKLRRMELDVEPLHILMPNTVVNQYVKDRGAASLSIWLHASLIKERNS